MACIISRIYQADDRVPFPRRLFRLRLDYGGEFRFASIGGIVEGFAATVTLRGMEVEAVFNPVRQPRDAGSAVDVGSDFEIQLVGIQECVGDVNADFGVIDGDTSGVRDGEISGAGAYASVDDGDGVRIDFGAGLGGQHGQGENHRGECAQDEENWGYGSWFSVHGHPYKGTLYKGTLSVQITAAVGFRGSGYQGSLPAR